MSYSNPNVKITYDGNTTGSQVDFGINFYYLEGDPVIVVEKWDYSDPNNPTQLSFVEGVDYTIDESSYPNTEVILVSPIGANNQLDIYRSTPPIQTSNFVNGSFPAESIEEALDRNMMVSQEKVDAIITNTTNITTNTNNINTNTTDIATNTADIADHEARIDVLEGQISSITTPQIYTIGAAETYNANTSDIIIIDTNDIVQINLPAATSGYFVRVKVSEKIANKTIVAASSIDGFGTTYTVSSEYESLSLVSDGTKWYII